MFQRLLRYLVYTPYCFLRFGEITLEVVERINSTPCEISFKGRNGKEVGYWACGYFHPKLPYRGWFHV